MSAFAIGICSVLYLIAAVDYMVEGQKGLAMAFLCYACANVGLIMAAKKI
jgi:hypothetical protein